MISTELRAGRRWIAPLATVVALIAVVGTVVAVTNGRSADRSPTSADMASFTPTPFPLVGPVPATTGPTSPSSGSLPRATAPPRTAPTRVAAPAAGGSGGGVTGGSGTSGSGRIVYGRTYAGTGTFYGATGAGSCLFDASPDLMVVAMNQQDYGHAQACGAWLAVTGPNGKTITVRVVDRCPECPAGALDLSQQAFTKLAPATAGQIPITWTLLSPALRGPVAYVYKDGSSAYWCGIQVRNHRNPVRSLAVKVGAAWTTLQRQDYNYFESPTGAGCGGAIRITDIYGHLLTDTGIAIRPGAVQNGHAQFGPPI